MSLETRKIEFVKEFLLLQDEPTITRLEKILGIVKDDSTENDLPVFTKKEMNARIDQAEADFSNGKFKASQDLLSKYE